MSNPIIVHDRPAEDPAVAKKTEAAEEAIIAIEDIVGSYYNMDLTTLEEFVDLLKCIYNKCKPFVESPAPSPAEKKTGNKVGITTNSKHVLTWSYANDNDIRVVGDVCAPGQMQISAYENKKLVLIGSAFGSRWLAIRLARFIRNGLVSHRMKRRRNKQNRAARKAAANNPVNPVNPVQNKEAV
jgi:hypothetical protein